MEKINKDELTRRLETAIKASVGKNGLNTMIYGWLNQKKYGQKYREAIWHRKWLYITEVNELSAYAGYDLTKNEP